MYDQLVMGVGTGPRYLINDITAEGEQTAFGISIAKNEGFNEELIEEKSKTIQSTAEIDDQMLSRMGEYVPIKIEKEDKYNKIPTRFH